MTNPLARIPWFVTTPTFLGAVVAAALTANYLGADYFKRTRLDEVNPLAATAVQSNDAPVAVAEGSTPAPAPATAGTDAVRGPFVLAKGNFRDGEPGHRGSGMVSLGRDAAGRAVLVLQDFSVTNGPDLHVILSASPGGSGQGLDLGKLKATDGTFSYAIPDGADLATFKSVTIWCASFPTIFAVATLEA